MSEDAPAVVIPFAKRRKGAAADAEGASAKTPAKPASRKVKPKVAKPKAPSKKAKAPAAANPLSPTRARVQLEISGMDQTNARTRMEQLVRLCLRRSITFSLEVSLFSRDLVRMEGPAGDWAREELSAYRDAFCNIVIDGQKQGFFRAASPDALASTILSIIADFPLWCYRDYRQAPYDVAEDVLQFIMAGVSKPPQK